MTRLEVGPSLVNLPPEVLMEVMRHLVDLEDLFNLARTCVSIHNVYRENISEILARHINWLVNLRCKVAAEADACVKAAHLEFTFGGILLGIPLVPFLDEYRVGRAQQLRTDQTFQDPHKILFYKNSDYHADIEIRSVDPVPWDHWPARNLEQLKVIYKLHQLIEHCVGLFCRKTLAIQQDENLTATQQQQRLAPLSQAERYRLYRAFYRFEVYDRSIGSSIGADVDVDDDQLWLCTFPPHECEEMFTVVQFLEDGWKEQIDKVSRYGRDFETLEERQRFVDEGLEAFLRVQSEQDLDDLAEIYRRCKLKEHLTHLSTCFALASPFRHRLMGGYPSDGSQLYFENDHPDCPNHGWLWSFDYKMSSMIAHRCHSSLRKIGHVMWDWERLATWSVYQSAPPTLGRNWEEHQEWSMIQRVLA